MSVEDHQDTRPPANIVPVISLNITVVSAGRSHKDGADVAIRNSFDHRSARPLVSMAMGRL
jgi:hypothetical protein